MGVPFDSPKDYMRDTGTGKAEREKLGWGFVAGDNEGRGSRPSRMMGLSVSSHLQYHYSVRQADLRPVCHTHNTHDPLASRRRT